MQPVSSIISLHPLQLVAVGIRLVRCPVKIMHGSNHTEHKRKYKLRNTVEISRPHEARQLLRVMCF